MAASVLPAAGSGAVRTENTIQRHFCTSRSICSKKDDQSVPANETSQKAAESQGEGKETLKKNLLDVIKDMKVQLNSKCKNNKAAWQTTSCPSGDRSRQASEGPGRTSKEEK